MLNFFKRTRRPAPVAVGSDPLKIRNLLDDPRLQAVMNTATTAVTNAAVSAHSPASLTMTSVTDGELVLGTAA